MRTLSANERIVERTAEARERAEALLASLEEARAASEERLAQCQRQDYLKQVTGRSSLENAIESTRRMIGTLDRHIAELERAEARGGGYTLEPRVFVGSGRPVA